jgi:hypothetical protein
MDGGGVLPRAVTGLRAWVPSMAGLGPRELIDALSDLERLSRAAKRRWSVWWRRRSALASSAALWAICGAAALAPPAG